MACAGGSEHDEGDGGVLEVDGSAFSDIPVALRPVSELLQTS